MYAFKTIFIASLALSFSAQAQNGTTNNPANTSPNSGTSYTDSNFENGSLDNINKGNPGADMNNNSLTDRNMGTVNTGTTGLTNPSPMGTSNTNNNNLGSRQTVIEAQQALTSNGFSLSADGVLGPETRSAVRQFQAKNGLSQSGILDPQTLRALNVNPANRTGLQ